MEWGGVTFVLSIYSVNCVTRQARYYYIYVALRQIYSFHSNVSSDQHLVNPRGVIALGLNLFPKKTRKKKEDLLHHG